VDLIIRSKFIY